MEYRQGMICAFSEAHLAMETSYAWKLRKNQRYSISSDPHHGISKHSVLAKWCHMLPASCWIHIKQLGRNAVPRRHQQESNLVNAISYDILSGICIWHIFWNSFWHSIRYIFGDSLWWSTLIRRLLFGRGGDHCDQALALEVPTGISLIQGLLFGCRVTTVIKRLQLRSGGVHFDPEVAVRAPVGTLVIKSLHLRPGGDHFDPGLVVRARRGPLRSRACGWGLVGITSILGLLFRSGRGPLWSRACSWGPADEEEDEEAEVGQVTQYLAAFTWQAGNKKKS